MIQQQNGQVDRVQLKDPALELETWIQILFGKGAQTNQNGQLTKQEAT